MKQYRIFLYIFVAFLALFVIAAGCTTPSPAPATPVPTPAPTVTTPVPVETTAVPATTTTLPPTPLPTIAAPITSDDVTQHFMDIAFGSGTTQLDRLSYSPTAQKPKEILSLFNGNSADLALVESFISEFNDLSATNQFSTNIKTSSTGDIVIRFVSPAGMDAINKDMYTKEYKSGGVSYAKFGPDTIYVNNDLKGDQRSHILLWSLLYELGFKGESLKYPDSIFYYQDNTNTKLSLIDQKAIQIMYGAGLYPGMTVANVKNVVYVKTN